MLSAILTFLVMGVIAIAVAGVVLAVVGAALGLAIGIGFFLLFKVLPLMLVGYVVMRLIAPKASKHQLSEADRKWLES
jgi:predicted phage tail protein